MENISLENTKIPDIHHIRGYHQAVKETVQSNVRHITELDLFARELKKSAANIRMGVHKDLPKSSQSCFDNWKDEIWTLWKDFGVEKGKEIAKTLHDRRKIEGVDILGIPLYLNLNLIDFYRDTNISFSLYDEQKKKEVAILGVFILPNKTIEIFQLQGRRKEGIGKEHFGEMISALKKYFKDLGFERIVMVKSSKNYLTKKPTFIPQRIRTQEALEKWLESHRTMMKLTYDVNPVRKWGFKKPSKEEDEKHFSGEIIL